MKKPRTTRQNKALHLFFTMLMQELNDAGLDQRKVLKPSVDIPWTPHAIKEQLWRPIQESLLGKESTTELETKEMTQVWEVLNRHLGEKFGVHVPFPSEEQLFDYEQR